MAAELLIRATHHLGECVLWCERSRRVFWTDITAQHLHSFTPASGERQEWILPERLCCFAFTNDPDRLLVGLEGRLAFFNLTTLTIVDIVNIESELPMTRMNDGRCDRTGRFVFGTMDERDSKAAVGSFYRLNADLSLETLPLPAIAIANSICFSLDGTAMYFCDSMQKHIYRWNNYEHAEAPHITVFASLEQGAADGSTIDAAGYLWNAQWGAARVVRYNANGQVDRIIELPVTQPSCVCLGGDALDTLYVTTAQQSLSQEELHSQPLAGSLFYTRLHDDQVRGVPESRFAG